MPDAFDIFYRAHLPLIFAAALARTADRGRAEDLAQETMLRAWRHFPLLAGRDANGQRAWLLTTLRHRDIEQRRRAGTVCLAEASETDLVGEDSEAPVVMRLDVARALRCLPEAEREIVVLRYFQQLTSRDIGEVLGMPEGTVRRKLGEARAVLAERLAEWEEDV